MAGKSRLLKLRKRVIVQEASRSSDEAVDKDIMQIRDGNLLEHVAPRNDLVPKLNVQLVDINDLAHPSRNVRRSNKTQIKKVRNSLKKFGLVKPILVGKDGIVVNGNVVVEAARQLGVKRIPCIRVEHLSEFELRQLRLTLNKTQETGDWDIESLKLEFEDFLEFNVDIEILGFETPEIDQILSFDDDFTNNVSEAQWDRQVDPKAQVSVIGDLWMLGQHRVLCGNALSLHGLKQLCQNEPIRLPYTDPPYNVPMVIPPKISGVHA